MKVKNFLISMLIGIGVSAPVLADKLSDAIQYRKNGDFKKSFLLFKELADKGDVAAQHNVANMYFSGEGVSQNYAEAAKWYKKAAEKGLKYSQFELSGMYFMGQGVRQNDAEWMKWLRKAAENGHSTAQFTMGVVYFSGLKGVKEDKKLAQEWFQKGCDSGEPRACEVLKQKSK